MKIFSKNLVLECAAFAAAAAALNLYVFHGEMFDWNPSPLWVIVLVVSMRHGSPAGLIGGCVAAALHLWELTRRGYDFEYLIHRTPEMLVVPVLFLLAGMYLGETRERLARRADYFRNLVDALNARLDANEIRRLNLERAHVELEKRIAGQADSLLGVHHNLNRLDAAETEDELWKALADVVSGDIGAAVCGVWRMEPARLLAASGPAAEAPPPLALMAARKRGIATVADWAAARQEAAPAADMAALVSDDANDPVVIAASGLEFGKLNRNAAIHFELIARRARTVVRELRRLEGLRRVSISDPRLGLGSESYLKTRIREQALLSRRHNIPVCLVCCAFETPPEAEHAEKLLIVLACAIRSAIRSSDGVAYFVGRETFVVMLPRCEPPGAAVVMKNVAANLAMLGSGGSGGAFAPPVKWNCEKLGGDMDGEAMYDRLFAGMGVDDADAVSVAEVRVSPSALSGGNA